jgi:FkbM family methyltransferase
VLSDRVTVEYDGGSATFTLTDPRDVNSFCDGARYERPMVETFLRCLEPGDVVYDIGANIGFYSCLATEVLEDVRIVAFEPNEAVHSRLRENLRLANADWQLITKPLLEQETRVGFRRRASDLWDGGSYIVDQRENHDEQLTSIAGDEIAGDRCPPPTVMQIDAEGAELAIVEGFSETLRNGNCRHVFCEVHPKKLRKPYTDGEFAEVSQLVERLETFGFTVERFTQRELSGRVQQFLWARKSELD